MHILWLKTELLHPLDKGGRIRSYHMLRHLARQHRITYLTLDDGQRDADAVERAAEYCSDLVRIPTRTANKGTVRFYWELARNLASPLPYAVAKYRVAAMRREITRVVQQQSVDLVTSDFLFPAVNLPEGLPVPSVLFQHNVEAMIWERHAAVARGAARRAYMRRQWRRMLAFEGSQCRRFDHVVAVSPDDAAWFASEYAVRHVTSVPTGVDTDYFRPTGNELQDPHALVFTGSMDWMPNEDAMRFFASDVLPALAASVPEVTLDIVGRNPSPAMRALAARDARVRVTGTVPDVRPYLARARVFVVPLRVGGGTRLKIYEAMAMGKPIVSTSVGVEGLPVRHGEHLLIADTPPAFAAAVERFIREPIEAAAFGARAAELVRSRFGWARAAEQFANVCERTLESRIEKSTTSRLVHTR